MNEQQQVAQVKQVINEAVREQNVPPQQIHRAGEMAMAAIKDPALYPIFVQQIEKIGLAKKGEFPENINYYALALFVAAAKMVD
jgi:hypothetical protein